MAKPPVSEQVQVNFRMPADLRDRIKVAAQANNRSMNAEIVATLEREYPPERFKEIVEELARLADHLATGYNATMPHTPQEEAEMAEAMRRLTEQINRIAPLQFPKR